MRTVANVHKPTKPKRRAKIKQSLMAQLEEMGADVEHFQDLIEDYLILFDIKNQLSSDIDKRGVTVEWRNSSTQKGFKKNDSVSELVKVNAQMLKILQQLEITVREAPVSVDEMSDGEDDDF